MAWNKISDKLYQIQIDGKYVDISVPYAKAEKIFAQFIGAGGLIDAAGSVTEDIIPIIGNFSAVGDIMLTTYGPKGAVIEEGDCSTLSIPETLELFKVAADVVENFIKLISEAQTREQEGKGTAKVAKKTK